MCDGVQVLRQEQGVVCLVLGEGFDEPRVREVEDLPVRLVHRRRLQAQGGGHRELGGGARARLFQTEKIISSVVPQID